MRGIQHKSFWLILLTFFLIGCANVVTPTGGPKDETPPKVESILPPHNNVFFNQEEIRIFFDEFVKLDKVNEEIIISPPLKEKPDVKIKGKSVIFSFNEKLKDSTTYSISFGNSIKDITEGNIIKNLVYAFSTGSKIDAFSLEGEVVDAFNKEAEEGMTVMLYDQDTDSLPLSELPLYVSKSDENGKFHFYNLAEKEYKIFALADINANMKYDNPEEKIAFIDSLISPNPPAPKPDTNLLDSIQNDSLPADSNLLQPIPESLSVDSNLLHPNMDTLLPRFYYQLLAFKQADTLQRLLSVSSVNEVQIKYVYSQACANFKLHSPDQSLPLNSYQIEINNTRDTVDVWLKEKNTDTLKLISSIEGLRNDTSVIVMKTSSIGSRSKQSSPTVQSLRLKSSISSNGFLEYPYKLKLTSDFPIIKDSVADLMILTEDSIPKELEWSFADSLLKREIIISADFQEEKQYHLRIAPKIFISNNMRYNDTLNVIFKTRKLEDYGKLSINIDLPFSSPLLVLIQNDKGIELQRITLKDSAAFHLDYLVPGLLNVKCIVDDNNNGKWDPGNYHLKLQPEKVYEIANPITIKSSFTQDIEWLPIKKPSTQ